MDAGVHVHESRSPTSHNQKDVVVKVRALAFLHLAGSFQSSVDQAIHPLCLSFEIPLLELLRIGGHTGRVEAVVGIEWIQFSLYLAGIVVVHERRAEAPQGVHRDSGVGVYEDNPVGRRQPGQLISALGQLSGSLTIGGAFLCHCLIKTHRRSSAAVAKENDLGNTRQFSEKLHARPDVEGDVFPIHDRLVVIEARVHGENRKLTLGQFNAAQVGQKVRSAMHDEDPHVRCRARVGFVKNLLHIGGAERNVERIALGQRQ